MRYELFIKPRLNKKQIRDIKELSKFIAKELNIQKQERKERVMITKERYEMLKDALEKGASLAPIDFKNIDEYETEAGAFTTCGEEVKEHDNEIKDKAGL